MDDRFLERQAAGLPVEYLQQSTETISQFSRRKFRILRAQAIKELRKAVGGRPLTVAEFENLDREIAKYA